MHLLRYAWSVLLLIAAALAPNMTTAIVLAIAGLCTICLAVSRERRLKHLMGELADLLSIQHDTHAPALERSLTKLWQHVLILAAASESIVLLALLVFNLDITTARNYCLLILVALAPLGLEAELAVLVRGKRTKSSETVRTAVGYATEDAHALLGVIGLSFIGTLWLHIPPALSVLQILFITCVARPLLSGHALQSLAHKQMQPTRVFFTALLSYGSFIFFFIRHYLEPRYADSINPLTWQATTTALLVFIACQASLLVFNPWAPRSAYWRSLGLLLTVLLAAYTAPGHHLLMTHGPAWADWVWVIIATLVYVACVLLRQEIASHSRKAVLALHRQ